MKREAEYMTINEIASELAVSPDAVRARIKEGAFPTVKIGRLKRVPRSDYKRWLSGLRKARHPKTMIGFRSGR